VTDLACAAVTVLFCASGVALQLALDEIVLFARETLRHRASITCERTGTRNRGTLAAYADAHGWKAVFPLGVVGELDGVGITISQRSGGHARTVVTAQGPGLVHQDSLVAELAPLSTRLPGARVQVLARGSASVEWPSHLVDPRALDATIDALVAALSARSVRGAYR
jgi:hypothetical protein